MHSVKQLSQRRHGSPIGDRGQSGMASIMITLITMIVISLIVLGFAAISRREQRQSLDQQLSTQAFYAAESAVADAKKVIEDRLASGQPLIGKTDCVDDDQNGGYPEGNAMTLDAPNNVAFTCLRVDLAPGDLRYDGVTDSNIVVPIRTTNPLNRLEITWQPNPAPGGNPQTGCPNGTNNVFSNQTNWTCGFGLMRLDLVSVEGAITGGDGAGSLMANSLAAYFVPTSTAASGQLSHAANIGRPNVVAANCNSTSCTANITNLNGGSREYALRLSSQYRGSNVRIAAFSGASPSPIIGAQVLIDATGKAQDVLRRIQVRVPLTNADTMPPGYAVQSNGSICKRFATASGYFAIPGDIDNADATNDMCRQQSDGSAPGAPSGGSSTLPPAACAVPNDIAFVLDTSSSMLTDWGGGKDRAEVLQDVTKRFIANAGIGTLSNNAAIITFDEIAELHQSLTGNQTQLNKAVDNLNNYQNTYYLAGLNFGQTELEDTKRPQANAVMIFISDGAPTDEYGDAVDNNERNQIINKANAIKGSGIALYTIGIGDPDDYDNALDVPLLTNMAGNGGTYADATSSSELQNIIDQLANSLTCN